jgi:hypothetical protein
MMEADSTIVSRTWSRDGYTNTPLAWPELLVFKCRISIFVTPGRLSCSRFSTCPDARRHSGTKLGALKVTTSADHALKAARLLQTAGRRARRRWGRSRVGLSQWVPRGTDPDWHIRGGTGTIRGRLRGTIQILSRDYSWPYPGYYPGGPTRAELSGMDSRTPPGGSMPASYAASRPPLAAKLPAQRHRSRTERLFNPQFAFVALNHVTHLLVRETQCAGCSTQGFFVFDV